MSLIIKGVDMPKSGESMTYSSKEIIEIPRPHGRLIDADEHIKSLREGFCGERCRRNHDCFNCGIDGYIRIVENEPTVLEAEVSE